MLQFKFRLYCNIISSFIGHSPPFRHCFTYPKDKQKNFHPYNRISTALSENYFLLYIRKYEKLSSVHLGIKKDLPQSAALTKVLQFHCDPNALCRSIVLTNRKHHLMPATPFCFFHYSRHYKKINLFTKKENPE